MHAGNSAHHPELGTKLYSWFKYQRKDGFSVSTSNIVCKALQIDANFKGRCKKKLR